MMPMRIKDVLIDDDAWRTSTRSGDGSACVEVASVPDVVVGVRDSKDRQGPQLRFEPPAWGAFIADVKAGKYDL